jgi:universal stress protein A
VRRGAARADDAYIEAGGNAMSSWTRLCCPIDFSPPSDGALQAAAELASRLGGTLTIVHVLDVLTRPVEGEPVREEQLRAEREARRRLEEARASVQARFACAVEAELLMGDPAWEVAKLLTTDSYDLGVLGTHGRTGLRKVVVGSVTERVLRHATCPILVIRPPGAQAKLPPERP